MTETVPRPAVPEGPYLIAGLGVAGLAAARSLAGHAKPAAVTAWARSLPAVLASAGEELDRLGVEVRVGGDGVDLLDSVRCVVKSPGIPDDERVVQAALERGITLIDEAELGWRLDRRPFVGVTGTNGKSTVCALIAAALAAAGVRAVVAGNSEDGPALTAALDSDATAVVAELSSFQLRHSPTLLPDVGVLTNCSRDSWHRHGGHEGYERDKARIALRGTTSAPHAVLPADDPLGARLAAEIRAIRGDVTTFGAASGADCRVIGCDWDLDVAELTVDVEGEALRLSPRLPGRHNALNVAAALAAARAHGVDLATATRAIERFEPVPGRFERIPADAPFDLLVDYAHNPDGLRQVLATVRHVLRARGRGRLVAVASALPVFDDGQYVEMGAAVGEGADVVIATTERLGADAPLEEPPAFFTALRAKASDLTVEIDRRQAVHVAVDRAEPGDVVVVLGRGRRRTPIYDLGGAAFHVDDREQARVALAELTS